MEFIQQEFYKVYVLFKENIPIYIGVTSNLKYRLYQHKKKQFDSYQVIFQNTDKNKCLDFERACIVFNQIINPNSLNTQKLWVANSRVYIKIDNDCKND